LRQTKIRLENGNVTATDVSQSEARLNVGRTQLFAAEANYASARAVYRQVIGLEPGRLSPAAPVDRFTPHTLPAAIATGVAQNAAVTAAQHNVDIATHQVKVAEGALYPVVSLVGSVQKNYESALISLESFNASGVAQLDLTQVGTLQFEKPDFNRFPCLKLAYDALNAGGTAPALLNAANEVAVAAFLEQRIGFRQIDRVIAAVMDELPQGAASSIEAVMAQDALARAAATRIIAALPQPENLGQTGAPSSRRV